MTYCGQLFNMTDLSQFGNVVQTQLAMASITVFVDGILAAVQIWFLWKARTGVKTTDSIINRLVAYIVGSGLVTALCALGAVISAGVSPQSLVDVIFDVLTPKCQCFKLDVVVCIANPSSSISQLHACIVRSKFACSITSESLTLF